VYALLYATAQDKTDQGHDRSGKALGLIVNGVWVELGEMTSPAAPQIGFGFG
jgi:hypothetical protein